MKLYYKPGACSLAPHIVMRECDFDFTLVRVDLAAGKTERGEDYRQINPKGQVPALQLDDGTLLTEVNAVVQYLADLKPDRQLLAESGTISRYQTVEWLSFISSELHKRFSPLFKPNTPESYKIAMREQLAEKLSHISQQLGEKSWLQGTRFTLADCYLYPVYRWAKATGIGQENISELRQWAQRVEQRPGVKAALQAEELTPAAIDA